MIQTGHKERNVFVYSQIIYLGTKNTGPTYRTGGNSILASVDSEKD